MSMDFGAPADDPKVFRNVCRDRILKDLLKPDKDKENKSAWKYSFDIAVEYLCNVNDVSAAMCDALDACSCDGRTFISSCSYNGQIHSEDYGLCLQDGRNYRCRNLVLLLYNAVVEDLFKRREPMPSMDAIYFLQPLKENIFNLFSDACNFSICSVIMLLSDMSGRCPLYRKAYIFFSSPIPKELVSYIKNDSSVIPRIGALREMNLEFFTIDMQGFVTDHDTALNDLYGVDGQSNSKKFNDTITTMATRIATTFASLKVYY
ncbi:hypothetical protein PR202_gb18050 [Eleusine coracana subsp. coracana]|uniref:Uncharacterized protein n=1 Tax=Eleusine coracana subsp. coracana TaxID=191504 RepID=A0AAV5F3S5_ELECO|nr:hypothetical protein PR202_gb17983 [Eleusine coracana subsp. coracana]GJN29795.1 hypothetical protein PR202_gb18050 [Eleusine coracana subsp. coracana]